MSGRKLARRACDGCKIRKVKCNEATPCANCINAKIQCTWLKQSQPRGPRRLRDATLAEIRRAQDLLQTRDAARRSTRSSNVTDPDPPPEPSSEVGHLVFFLCLYRVQLYAIWPIIKVERLIASLQSESPDVEVYALAYALAAATATRTRQVEQVESVKQHAQTLEAKCQASRAQVPQGRPPNLTTVRIAFFLHIYYESLEANSMKSMLYLREAIVTASRIGLHKESYYLEVPPQEREIRRRVLWLLFTQERTCSALFDNTPTTLRTKISLPSTTDTDEADVLVGFQILSSLFQALDEKRVFHLLEELDIQASPNSYSPGSVAESSSFAEILDGCTAFTTRLPSVQLVDLSVTITWLHVLNLRVLQIGFLDSRHPAVLALLGSHERLAHVMSQSSQQMIEAHGFCLQLKLSVISGAVQELLASTHMNEESRAMRNKLMASHNTVTTSLTAKLARNAHHELMQSPDRLSATPSHEFKSPNHPPWDTEMLSPRAGQSSRWEGSTETSSCTRVVPFQLPQEFATNNNYDELFDAVQMAGVQSSDTINDLFNNTSLEHYGTFDDHWAHEPRNGQGVQQMAPTDDTYKAA